MKLPDHTFLVTDWSVLEASRHPGTAGFAEWRTVQMGDIRIRHVTYSPGYLADHWCDRGHILFVLSGSLVTELRDGRTFTLTSGMSYQVSSFGDLAHRSSTAGGACLFVVD